MGEVYRARDTKLGRDVAIKVLPPAVASDPERVARFEREAKTLAALNHPRIAHIHGFEDSTGIAALVMELVEGSTLAERIDGLRSGLPIAEALAIAKQIAEGLEAAHDHGIVHRDLKPANIKVSDDGQVKILDFGLAKAVDAGQASGGASGLSMSPTLTTPAQMTGLGTVLGTAAYMSPEQAKGRPVDKRADVWAFGAGRGAVSKDDRRSPRCAVRGCRCRRARVRYRRLARAPAGRAAAADRALFDRGSRSGAAQHAGPESDRDLAGRHASGLRPQPAPLSANGRSAR